MVTFSQVVSTLDIDTGDRRAIEDLASLRGGSEVLNQAQDLVRGPAMDQALKRLARTYYLVSRYGYAGRLLFDFGILKNFDYYTGIVFEVLSGDIGFPIGGGGRYNNLLERFGRPSPAVGFAIGLDRLHIAVAGQGNAAETQSSAVVLVGGFDEELDLARELRSAGVSIFAMAADTGEDEAVAIARDAGIAMVAVPVDEAFNLVDVAGASARRVSRDELAAAVGA
jgi:ATP phosphoribosyltransferase regulatory subunit